jgi:hypothetical protein
LTLVPLFTPSPQGRYFVTPNKHSTRISSTLHPQAGAEMWINGSGSIHRFAELSTEAVDNLSAMWKSQWRRGAGVVDKPVDNRGRICG